MRKHSTQRLGLTVLALSSIYSLAGAAALSDVFQLAPGSTKSGCDAYASVLSDYWDDAVKIIAAAKTAFDGFDDGPTEVPKIGKMFMGLDLFEMSNELWLDGASAPALLNIKSGFKDIQQISTKTFLNQKTIQMACGSDHWDEMFLTDKAWVKDPAGTGKMIQSPTQTMADEMAGQAFFMAYQAGTIHIYYSEVLSQYELSDGANGGPPGYCDQTGAIALSGPGNTGNPMMTLCPTGFFKRACSATLDTSQGLGTYLQNLEPYSLTLIHELFHTIDVSYPDLAAYTVPENIPATNADTGDPNPAWPGPAANFVAQNDQADKVLECQLLALAQPQGTTVSKNPQNLAWAAVAVYLSQNGAKLDYSTGLARPLASELGEVAPGPPPATTKERDLSKRWLPRHFFA